MIIAMVFAGCSAQPERTVNQQLYPYLTVNTAGEIRVVAGVTMSSIHIPDDVYINGQTTATIFRGFEDEAGKAAVESISFGVGITDIGSDALKDATGLKEVSFESGSKLSSIGSSAFQNTGITSIELPGDTAIEIGDNAFRGTSLGEGSQNYGGVLVNGGTPDADITGGLFGNIVGELEIGEGAFAGTSIGPNINLPGSTASIGNGAFADLGGTGAGDALKVALPAAATDNSR